ncbi:MAG: hypothetical protein IIY21_16295 [Clostridiales bacterium]|nr:hypothetical protein [Clostridiales bacterium]MBQ1570124.1 hypothetical protein [Clostridiales bacterium]
MTKLEHAIKHIKTRADVWAVKEVTEALQSISERLDKALSQEPCDDAISRKKAIYVISARDGKSAQIEALEQLPSVTQKSGKWIPFSERLPKPFEHCLITTTDGEVIYHYDDGHYSKYKAWMPLPEPYKAESEE